MASSLLDPPTYTIDLSSPPAERYHQLALDFAPQMRRLTSLFDDVVSISFPFLPKRMLHFAARTCLRRVYSQDETAELKGIATAAEVDMYLLVALNTFLDSFMGCTSGGVRVKPERKRRTRRKGESIDAEKGTLEDERTVHFRTLDWDMPELREVIVVLEYVRPSEDERKVIIARSITYAGYIGVLTGVKPGLSLSLNFRPNHTCSTASLLMHQTLVMLGARPSIATMLRRVLLSNDIPDLAQITTSLRNTISTPCYLILSDGHSTAVLEKDYNTAQVWQASHFIVHTNHDTDVPDASQGGIHATEAMKMLVEESQDRKECITGMWENFAKRSAKVAKAEGSVDTDVVVPISTVLRWVKAFPIMNAMTHYACVLDPVRGTILWLERGDPDAGMLSGG